MGFVEESLDKLRGLVTNQLTLDGHGDHAVERRVNELGDLANGIAAQARRDGMVEAAKIVCPFCQDGIPLTFNRGEERWQHAPNPADPRVTRGCLAARIHAAIPRLDVEGLNGALKAIHGSTTTPMKSVPRMAGEQELPTIVASCNVNTVRGGCDCCHRTGIVDDGMISQPCHCMEGLR